MIRRTAPSSSLLLVVLLLLTILSVVVQASPSKVKFVSLLANDVVLDRYAAAVAATEPLREDRDKVLRENINPIQLWWVKATKGNLLDAKSKGPHAEAVKKAYTYHVVQSGKIIKSLGLSVSDFNTITRRLAHDSKLRNKVLKQAYLYRLESRVNERLLSSLPEEDMLEALTTTTTTTSSSSSSSSGSYLPPSQSSPVRVSSSPSTSSSDAEGRAVGRSSSSSSSGGGFSLFHPTSWHSSSSNSKQTAATVAAAAAAAAAAAEEENESPVPTNVVPQRVALFAKSLREIEALRAEHNHMRVALFAKSLREIEALRAEHNHMLKQEFKVDSLPAGATDPSLFPMLNSKVQNLCLKFPLQAEEIAQKNGFEASEFNSLLTKAKKNPFFRWRVERMMKEQGK